MKHHQRRLSPLVGVLLLAFISICVITATLTAAQSTTLATITPTYTTTQTPTRSTLKVQSAYIRSGPGDTYGAIGAVDPDSLLIAVSRNANADWVLIRYNRGFGWLWRELAHWVINVDALPIITEANLTPSPVPGVLEVMTPVYPTNTPLGDYIRVNAISAYVRAGPAQTHLRLGQLFSGQTIEPVGRTANTSWIMIRYGEGFGWIRADLAVWVTDLDTLPILTRDNLTPSATFTSTYTTTPTATFTATIIPSDTATLTPTFTNTPTLTPSDTSTLTPTFTVTASLTPTVTYSITPSVTDTSIPTATPTFTPSITASLTPSTTDTSIPTATPTITLSPTVTYSVTPNATDTFIPTATLTLSPTFTPSITASLTPTDPYSLTPSATDTSIPTATWTITPSLTPSLTLTPSPTTTPTFTATVTTAPSATQTSQPTVIGLAPSPIPTDTPTVTLTPSETVGVTPTATLEPSATLTVTMTASATVTQTLTIAPTSTETVPTNTSQPTVEPSPTPSTTVTTESVIGMVLTDVIAQTQSPTVPTPSPQPPTNINAGDETSGGIPIEAVIGTVGLLGVLVYIGFYLRGVAAAERYADGFVIDQCPVCRRGELLVDTNPKRTFGIPDTRYIVRCSNCRSVLREVGNRKWRYAVDRLENIPLYDRLNNREVDEETLKGLLENPVTPPMATPITPPSFVDDDSTGKK